MKLNEENVNFIHTTKIEEKKFSLLEPHISYDSYV